MSQPAFKGQVSAILREMAKDVNGTLHQVAFNQPVGPGEPGTPLVPTQQNVTEDLRPKDADKPLDMDLDG